MKIRSTSGVVRDALQVLLTHPQILAQVSCAIHAVRDIPDWRQGGFTAWLARNECLLLKALNAPDEINMWMWDAARKRAKKRHTEARNTGFFPGTNHFHERINERAVLKRTIDQHAHKGMIRVVQSGRDCDGVEYGGGRGVELPATVYHFYKREREVGEWADGPFTLGIVPWEYDEPYEARDLVMEAHENGHPHSIVSRFP